MYRYNLIESPFVLLVKTYERIRVGSNVIQGLQSIRKSIEGKQRIENAKNSRLVLEMDSSDWHLPSNDLAQLNSC